MDPMGGHAPELAWICGGVLRGTIVKPKSRGGTNTNQEIGQTAPPNAEEDEGFAEGRCCPSNKGHRRRDATPLAASPTWYLPEAMEP